MSTISVVCRNLFTQTTLAQLPRRPDRGSRRNLARIVYRQARRPGIINPMPADQLPPRVPVSHPTAQCTQLPMRHVYKLHVPPAPKRRLLIDAIPRLARPHRKLKPKS